MKFKKDGKVFETISDALKYYCDGRVCDDETCAIFQEDCDIKCKKCPRQFAYLMGFEILDDEPEERSSDISQSIGNMTLAQAKEYCKNRCESRNCNIKCDLNKHHMCCCEPHEWELERHWLNPDELDICKALGAKWVSMDKKTEEIQVALWERKPVYDEGLALPGYVGGVLIASVNRNLFPNIHPGDCICVDELINIKEG